MVYVSSGHEVAAYPRVRSLSNSLTEVCHYPHLTIVHVVQYLCLDIQKGNPPHVDYKGNTTLWIIPKKT